MSRQENVVVGGGPAGCAAAILLARAGREVLLLEREAAPRDKVCGEFLSREAVHYLQALGLDPRLLGARRIRRLRLFHGCGALEADLPFTAWSVSRRLLDEALLQMAAGAGAELRRGTAVKELGRAGGRWELRTARQSFDARRVFLATGKHELRQWPRSRAANRRRIGFKMHLRLSSAARERLRDFVEVFLFAGGYAGLEAVEDGVANLCMLIERDVYAARGGRWPALLSWLAQASPPLAGRLEGARPLWERPLAIAGIPYGYLHEPTEAAPGLFRLGDQAAVIPSFAGDGIAIALHSGFLAAAACLAGEDSSAYAVRLRRDVRGPLASAGFLDVLTRSGAGRRAAFFLARRFPAVLPAVIERTRLAPAAYCTSMRPVMPNPACRK